MGCQTLDPTGSHWCGDSFLIRLRGWLQRRSIPMTFSWDDLTEVPLLFPHCAVLHSAESECHQAVGHEKLSSGFRVGEGTCLHDRRAGAEVVG